MRNISHTPVFNVPTVLMFGKQPVGFIDKRKIERYSYKDITERKIL